MEVKKIYQQVDEYNRMLHRIFRQTEDGQKLLAYWEGDLRMEPGNSEGADPYHLGRVEGRKEFVRTILRSIEQAEVN